MQTGNYINWCSDGYTPFLITPDDVANLVDANGRPTAARAISFASAGALSVEVFTGETVVIPSGALAAGRIHNISIRKVHATGTTATGIVGYK